MDLKNYSFEGGRDFSFDDFPTSQHISKDFKDAIVGLTKQNTQRIAELQDKLYAEGTEGLVIMLQAMDAAGKDGAVKHVMSGVNPQGINVTSFKTPSKLELAHDYLWRAIIALPERGYIGLFNRSYYEDVLVVRVHEMWKGYQWPKRCYDMSEKEFFDRRYGQIRNFEEYLYQNGYRVVKIFLNVSPDEQCRRFLDRIDDETKNWKFSSGDISERQLWSKYMSAYENMIENTSTKHAPWYIVPADQKWVSRCIISEAILRTLEEMDPQYPDLAQEERDQLQVYRAQLLGVEPGNEEALAAADKALRGQRAAKKKQQKKLKRVKKVNEQIRKKMEELAAAEADAAAEASAGIPLNDKPKAISKKKKKKQKKDTCCKADAAQKDNEVAEPSEDAEQQRCCKPIAAPGASQEALDASEEL